MVSREDVATIARDFLVTWEPLSPYLGLTRQQDEEIRRSYPNNYAMQKYECLQRWKELKGSDKATYSDLISAAKKAGNKQLADSVNAMLSRKMESEESKQIQHQNPSQQAELNNITHQASNEVITSSVTCSTYIEPLTCDTYIHSSVISLHVFSSVFAKIHV